jgi:glutamate synthase domain-containing protein 2/glutamate synthase domain-containing protein 1/glutamate synthase domain-containing protein 3
MVSEEGLYDARFEHDSCGVGFIVQVNGLSNHAVIMDGLRILKNLEHRGAIGGDKKTSDGAGILIQIPHTYFQELPGFSLPEPGLYGVGMFFLSQDKATQDALRKLIEEQVIVEGGTVLSWREVPTDDTSLGDIARAGSPSVWQLFVTVGNLSGEELERKLYVVRKRIENNAREAGYTLDDLYIPSFSCRTIVYKGMLTPDQFEQFYPDISEESFQSSFALVHQRYSTNTFPSWPLAQPFRRVAHNGEINTLRRNSNNMKARESNLSSRLFKDDIKKIVPVINEQLSDSAILDNVFELLTQGGRSLEHAITMMIPEAFGTRYHISQDKRAFFDYHASIMEPWDGPAAVVFCDGRKIGAVLDRNGLRPVRYVITKTGRVVVASEVGVLDLEPEEIREKGRLAPGKLLMVDLEQNRIMKDNEVKSRISRQKPYRRWLEQNKIELRGLFQEPGPVPVDHEGLVTRQLVFGYTREDVDKIVIPMVKNSQEPIGSMGNDVALAVLSEKPQLLYNYFRQMFAQVTNPPIDPYRESLVMSLMSFVGRERNLLAETPEHCRQLKLSHPVLTNDDIHRLKHADIEDFKVDTISFLYPADPAQGSLEESLETLCRKVEEKIDQGCSLIILSDRGVNKEYAPIPALLAIGSVHAYLVRRGKRHLSGLVLETGEARTVHHFATLVAYGASGINPYLVFETIVDLKEQEYLSHELSVNDAFEHYINAVKKGLLKIMSKMGVSTIRSYRGSQLFEAVGLNETFVDAYFPGTLSRIGGVGIETIDEETRRRHWEGFVERNEEKILPSGGVFNYRKNGEKHLLTPEAIVLLQRAVRNGDYATFKEYSKTINDTAHNLCTLRGLFDFRKSEPVPLEEVEEEQSIVKRFFTGAMSFGSLSKEAHETLAIAMNRLEAGSNSGEGGEDEARYIPLDNGDSRKSMVKQVASGRFGVTSNYLVNCRELQIKMAQGAKPGEGGQLPGHKVDQVIARVRHSTEGVGLISPPPHHDIYSIEDLAQLIYDLKHANSQARVSVKLVAESGVGTVAAGVSKGKADMVLISGSDGGTGAAPLSSIYHAGSFWEIGLAETQQVLTLNNLRKRIRVQVDGQLRTGRDVVIAALLGGEEFGFGTIALVSLGCVLMRKCHQNSCPVGIATQNEELRKRFRGKPEHLINFMTFLAREVREIMAELGVKRFDELVGRVDYLHTDASVEHFKARGLDFSHIFQPPQVPDGGSLYQVEEQEHDFSKTIDTELLPQIENAIEHGTKIKKQCTIRNFNRSTGGMISSAISRRYGSSGLPDNSIEITFTGSAGQSFGSFLAHGVTFVLEGDANDYMGKGLSGGRIIVYPPKKSTFIPERNIITGNVNLFGATAGEVYINGMAGERFAVRNSGAIAVVEGVGDHGCEYMTGGRVVILGKTGINFAAGMSGGIAFILDEDQLFDTLCNLEMVDVEPVTASEDVAFLHTYISNHMSYTESKRAAHILERWDEHLPYFVKVMPVDYRLALERIRQREWQESELVEVTEEVY